MRLFRRKHKAEVYDAGFGYFNFQCTCGVTGRAIQHRDEIATKARLHVEAAQRQGR
ncbi:hypothetical protein ABZ916_20110 [Streptomyces sp. NPDC046853]|uniref:hypothetical protein n=1 Tax=Streptomyces sp. NPDC046853 TaxID=3154920 RepID=UPI0033C60062